MLLIKNGLIYIDEKLLKKDILIKNGDIVKIGHQLNSANCETIDASKQWVLPAFTDLHVHLRDPGFTSKEDIASGSRAALAGGFARICAKANTSPVLDNISEITSFFERCRLNSKIKIMLWAATTLQQKGKILTDIREIAKLENICGFSDDGHGIQNAAVFKQALLAGKENNTIIGQHCELLNKNTQESLGVMNEGSKSAALNYPGILNRVESEMIIRDLALNSEIEARYHCEHVSTKESLLAIANAKQHQPVTCEVTPHHLLLDENNFAGPNWKMNPPLRSSSDRKFLISALNNGLIDAIATDHAPHTRREKAVGVMKCPFGIIGLETCFPALYTELVLTRKVSLKTIVTSLTIKPNQILDIKNEGKIECGQRANLVFINPHNFRKYTSEMIVSKSQNTPFLEKTMCGWPTKTIIEGKVCWSR